MKKNYLFGLLSLFTVLFMYVKIPTGIPETQIQSAYGIGGFFAAMFGPIAGFLIAFIGHALSDIVQYGSAWWSWVIASGVAGLVMGLVYPKLHVEDGVLTWKDILVYNVVQVLTIVEELVAFMKNITMNVEE